MMRDKNIEKSNLIFKHLINDLSSFEEQELNKWLEDPFNQLQFDRICNSQNIDDKFQKHNEIDVNKDWRHVARKTTQRKFIKDFFKYAATILLPIGLFLAVFFISDTSEYSADLIILEVEEVVVKDRPVLITNDGTQLTLIGNDTTLVVDDAKVKVGLKDLFYKASDSMQTASVSYNTLKTPKGMKYKLTLDDGTIAWLNAKTTLKYPVHFSGKQREVFLTEGEAYFDVTKNKEKPFIVNFNSHKVKVLGTEFNVKSYEEDDHKHVTLVEGSVLIDDGNASVILKPNQQAIIDDRNAELTVNIVNTDLYSVWKDDVFMYKHEKLDVIMRDLERQYDMTIFYRSQKLKEKTFSMRVSKPSSFNEILDYLETTGKVSFEVKGNTLIVK